MIAYNMDTYELMDCGAGRRLERFGGIILDRPAPQAAWPKKLSQTVWKQVHAYYNNSDKNNSYYQIYKNIPEEWSGKWIIKFNDIQLALSLLDSGQVGVFPEQQSNWQWIMDSIAIINRPMKVFNGFAYTGAAGISAGIAGKALNSFELCNLDASKSAITRLKQNIAISKLNAVSMRNIVDDIISFLKREIKRTVKYNAFILDPPAFGKGKKGKTWSIKKDLRLLFDLVNQLIHDDFCFITLSCHDPRISKNELLDYLCSIELINRRQVEALDLIINSAQGNSLPCGICARWRSV